MLISLLMFTFKSKSLVVSNKASICHNHGMGEFKATHLWSKEGGASIMNCFLILELYQSLTKNNWINNISESFLSANEALR